MDGSSQAKRPKRRRLNFACNYCRARKTRCDEQVPSCHACIVAGVECITTNRRQPGVQVERRGAGPRPGQTQPDSTTSQVDAQARRSVSQSDGGSSMWANNPLTPVSTGGNTQGEFWRLNEQPPGSHREPATEPDEGSRFVGRLPLVPRIGGSNTLELLTGWLDLAFFRLGVKLNFSTIFELGNDGVETMAASIPVSIVPPSLPSSEESHRLVEEYFASVNPLFPLLEVDSVIKELQTALGKGREECLSNASTSLSMLVLYLVLAIASLERADDIGRAASYTEFCKSMLGQVIGCHSVTAVQIVFLLSLALRWQDKLQSSWSMLALCVSMAQALGFHLQRSPWRSISSSSLSAAAAPSTVLPELYEVARRTWWSIYAFDKLSAFEFGRPSTIRDSDCDQVSPKPGTTDAPNKPNLFCMVTSLAQVLSDINEKSIRNRNQEERSSPQSLETAIDRKVQETGEMVLSLMNWADGLPEGYRSRLDLVTDMITFPQAAFISVQYHNALLILLRNSFLISEDAIREILEKRAVGQPWEHVVRNGQMIAANAARSIVRLLVEGADQGLRPVFSTSAAPLHALYVLAVHLITHPGSRLVNSDLDLINNAVEIAQAQGQNLISNQLEEVVLWRTNGILLSQMRSVGTGEILGSC
ncbi:hypothetical protein QQX98_007864 [Neonectria punicea]|uniref:Zn(2)-C6 fungal-type domain-containing protein n=1 Tax=Neonectria punicea TaxID=979145 RepID=A0ABR1GWR8_9HYPO